MTWVRENKVLSSFSSIYFIFNCFMGCKTKWNHKSKSKRLKVDLFYHLISANFDSNLFCKHFSLIRKHFRSKIIQEALFLSPDVSIPRSELLMDEWSKINNTRSIFVYTWARYAVSKSIFQMICFHFNCFISNNIHWFYYVLFCSARNISAFIVCVCVSFASDAVFHSMHRWQHNTV